VSYVKSLLGRHRVASGKGILFKERRADGREKKHQERTISHLAASQPSLQEPRNKQACIPKPLGEKEGEATRTKMVTKGRTPAEHPSRRTSCSGQEEGGDVQKLPKAIGGTKGATTRLQKESRLRLTRRGMNASVIRRVNKKREWKGRKDILRMLTTRDVKPARLYGRPHWLNSRSTLGKLQSKNGEKKGRNRLS